MIPILHRTQLWYCFITTLNFGIRNGGGIGESAMEYYPNEAYDAWLYRTLFNLVFFLVINIVMLNIVFGIIIDKFADLRCQNEERAVDQLNVCFVCGPWQ